MVPKVRFADPLGICESSAGVYEYKNNMSVCCKPAFYSVSHIYIILENVFMSCNGEKQ